jgi:holliday junction resolvase Hjr
MNTKSKGTQFERELIKLFCTNNWFAIRAAGSGSSRYPSPDILAGNCSRKLAIECKRIKGRNLYLPKKEINQLREFSSGFGAEAWLAVHFGKKDPVFLMLEDLKETAKGYGVSVDLARTKGLLFEEVVGEL